MSLQALDKATRQKLSIWGNIARHRPFNGWRHSYNSILGAVEVVWWEHPSPNTQQRKVDSIVCSYEEAAAIMSYLDSCRRRPDKEAEIRARVMQREREEREAEAAAIRKQKAEQERQAALRLTSFPKWAAAGFPIYSLCQLQSSGGYTPMPSVQPKGMWMPEGFTTGDQLETAFWEYVTSKGCATCSTCGKRPSVHRRFTPPPNCIVPVPIPTEQPGLFSSLLGEITTCGFHWIRNVHTGYGSIGAKFELTPAKSGITLRCCDNNIKLDE